MKKMKYILFILVTFMVGIFNVSAKENKIYSIDIKVHINDDASANITEIWNMDVEQGTEVYKPMSNMGSSLLSDFKVTDESGKVYTYTSWNVNDSFSKKAYKNGINYTSNGFELCWGMSSYGKHTYKIEYKVTNFVLNLEDGQMVYWKLVNDSMNPAPQKVRIEISSNKYFEDTVPVWGYGYKGYAYVADGKIYMESENGIRSSEYMVLYANFDANTFQATVTEEGTKADWLEKAEEGTFEYDYNEKMSFWNVLSILISIFAFLIIMIVIVAISKSSNLMGDIDYGTWGKKINKNKINYFRDIPCKKDIYRAYLVATMYGLNKKKEDFLGTIFLKWLNEEKITIVETPASFLSKSKNSIDLKIQEEKTFSNQLEKDLYDMITEASKDGILENKEFEKWCSKNYSKILNWFDKVLKEEKQKLTLDGSLVETEVVKFKVFKSKVYQVQYSLREEAEYLAGLKKFLIDFSEMKNKEAIEVHLWKEYLMFAQIFGIANKVAKQFKNLYPDLITDMSYDNIIFVNNTAYTGVSHAVSARSRAQSYSSGGGGFSSGGGGGGSFGGGGGGGCR